MLQTNISPSRDIGQQKVGSKSHDHFTNLQTMCKTNIRIWDCFYHNCFGYRHKEIQRDQSSFIRLALRLPKHVSARLLNEASGRPCARERHITVGQNHLARMHANPLVKLPVNSAGTNIAWDKYKTPISILFQTTRKIY